MTSASRRPPAPEPAERRAVRHQRWRLVCQIHDRAEKPLVVLAIVWVAIAVRQLVATPSPLLAAAGLAIWAVFALQFALELTVAPHRLRYLRRHWLVAISLLLPAFSALRLARLMRVFRATRSISMLRLVTSANRGLRALSHTFRRRKVAWVLSATGIVTLCAAAAMELLESPAAVAAHGGQGGLQSYPDALWWAAMIMTTMGSDYWPRTPGGRMLAFLLASYAFTFLGYTAATIASHFVGEDASQRGGPQAARADVSDTST